MLALRTTAAILLIAVFFMPQGAGTALGADRRMTVIVPLGAGGALDRFARTAERFLPETSGIAVTIENHSPKRGEDGYRAFMQRPADGSSVLAWFEPGAAAYRPEIALDDLAVINVQEIEPPLLVARRETGWRSLQDLMAAARETPKVHRLGVGSRTGGGSLLTSALFSNLGLDLTTTYHGSGGKARRALVRGEVDVIAGSMNAMRRLGDKVVPLAVFSPRRLRSWPEVPTLREALGPEAGSAVSGAVYRFFAVHRDFADSQPEEFQALVESFRRMTQENENFRDHVSSKGVGAHWFGPMESTSLIQRSHQHFQRLIASLPSG